MTDQAQGLREQIAWLRMSEDERFKHVIRNLEALQLRSRMLGYKIARAVEDERKVLQQIEDRGGW